MMLMLGLSLLAGSVVPVAFAQDTTATKKAKKSKKSKKTDTSTEKKS
jgi:hypothetical protein